MKSVGERGRLTTGYDGTCYETEGVIHFGFVDWGGVWRGVSAVDREFITVFASAAVCIYHSVSNRG